MTFASTFAVSSTCTQQPRPTRSVVLSLRATYEVPQISTLEGRLAKMQEEFEVEHEEQQAQLDAALAAAKKSQAGREQMQSRIVSACPPPVAADTIGLLGSSPGRNDGRVQPASARQQGALGHMQTNSETCRYLRTRPWYSHVLI